MSLTDTINNTNTQKENIKTVANNIDNKLVELGGEKATNLADVVNKMGAMVTENYKKIAMGELNQSSYLSSGINDFKFPINFKASRIMFRLVVGPESGSTDLDISQTIDTKKSSVPAKKVLIALHLTLEKFQYKREINLIEGNTVRIVVPDTSNASAWIKLLDWIAYE